jgi:Zn-dependent protease with chaperone function
MGMAIALLAASLARPCVVAAERPLAPVPTAEKLHGIVSDLRAGLEISEPVVVAIVPNNALMMSIAPARHGGSFQLEIDATFLPRLTDEELEAAIAHELGHAWVFTHHPYLQTEELANQIAMRAVTRAALEGVYGKVWKHGGTSGDLARVLGPEPRAATGLAVDSPEP